MSLTLFWRADFRSTKRGIKVHSQLDLRGPIPTVVDITPARMHDVLWLDQLTFESGAFYVMDRSYVDFVRLARIARASAFLVTRAKSNFRFTRHHSSPVNFLEELRSDQIEILSVPTSRKAFPWPLRKVRYFDEELRRDFVFLTNHLELPALTVTKLYKLRWQVELFFRWIKQNLRIKHFYSNGINAVKTQIWIAVAVYIMAAILHKQLKHPGSLQRLMQILSVHPFEKTPIHELLTQINNDTNTNDFHNQLMLFWLKSDSRG